MSRIASAARIAIVVLDRKCAVQQIASQTTAGLVLRPLFMNQVIVPPIAPTSSGLDLSSTSMMGMVRYAGVLDIAFQPIVDIHTGRVFGFEALTRNVQALGFSSPTDFFDRCFDDGQLAAVEEYLITQAFDKFVRIEGHKSLKLFINLDGRNIMAGPKLVMVFDLTDFLYQS